MNERTLITLLVAGLLILGAGAFYYYEVVRLPFTFSSAELEFQGNVVREKLTFVPDKPYHTLYRDFKTQISLPEEIYTSKESIQINKVECSDGMPYYKDFMGRFFSGASKVELAYTEPNEFGCSFGDELGFEMGREYTITAEYALTASKLYYFNGKHYIKFVAYESSRHPLLLVGKNFIVKGDALAGKWIIPGIQTIIYVPYEPKNLEDYGILNVSRLDYTGGLGALILKIIAYILPAIACLLVWLLFGKERHEGDYPSELSQYPQERKAWEVSAYFHPPFGDLDNNFMPAMILDFYSRKIVDLDFRKGGLLNQKEMFVKILPAKTGLDDIETEVLSFLRCLESMDNIRDLGPRNNTSDGFFSPSKVSKEFAAGVSVAYEKLKKQIKIRSGEYIDYTGRTIIYPILLACAVLQAISNIDRWLVYTAPLIALIVNHTTSLFVRFKEDYYLEFQKWQGFRKYLSNSDSLKSSPPKGVVMWEKYLVYATAFGVGKTVLKEMKDLNLIDKGTYDNYCVVYMPSSFGTITSSGGGGGGGGMGGGGVGGGGGGGR